jgi:uroporphyrinogen decarboxylase
MTAPPIEDGVHAMVPRDRMPEHVRKLRDTYAITPGAPFVQREFWFYSMNQFYEQGLDPKADVAEVFGYDPPGSYDVKHLGWCEASFHPTFEEEVIEDRGPHEVIRDHAGRHLLVFKNRRQGFMPEYIDHPVKDQRTWEEDVRWRLDPATPGRFDYLQSLQSEAVAQAAEGYMISQHLIGGYMYLRSLIGPTEMMYAFYDMPELMHDCMRTWLELADAVIARHQEFITLDEIYFGEDICYNHGPLCSPDTMKEFLFPYYQQLLANVRSRQIDRTRTLHVQVDTDGKAESVIPAYQEVIGMDAMSPFEVASGCDVVEIGARHPELAIFGGIDKRVLAQDKRAIDRMVERILPTMRRRGGYIPHCDHSVPEEVSLDNYLHYRKRCIELGS